MDYETLSTSALTAAYNARLGKSVKEGSYARIRLIQALVNADLDTPEETETPAPITFEEVPGGVDYPAPAPVAEGSCPLCGADPTSQTAAGAEGTFLGDSCRECHSCGKAYNVFTGAEVVVAPTKKRRIINPQPKIDAKAAALEEADMTLFYDRITRLWMVTSKREGEVGVWNMPSREFAEYSKKELVDRAASILRP